MISSRSLKVKTPAPIVMLTSVETVIGELGAFAEVEKVEEHIERATSEIAALLSFPGKGLHGNALIHQTYVETVRIDEPLSEIFLSRYWVQSVPRITVNGTDLDPDQFEFDTAVGTVRKINADRLSCFPCGTIEVEFVSGFGSPAADDPPEPFEPLPRAIEAACISLINFRLSAGTGPSGCAGPVKSMSLPGAGRFDFDVSTPKLIDAMPGHVAKIVQPYSFMTIGL